MSALRAVSASQYWRLSLLSSLSSLSSRRPEGLLSIFDRVMGRVGECQGERMMEVVNGLVWGGYGLSSLNHLSFLEDDVKELDFEVPEYQYFGISLFSKY